MLVGLLETYADPDLWGNVRFGLDVLNTHDLPRVDPYSFTQDVPWTNHEWLSEAIMAVAYRAAGSIGLVFLKCALLVCAFALVSRSLKAVAFETKWRALALTAAGVLPIAHAVRPQLWTLLFLVLLCGSLTAASKRVWYVPLLFMFWSNMHGGWVVGMGVLGVWSVCSLVDPALTRSEKIGLVWVLGLSILGTLINPYGVGMWRFVLSTVRLTRADISEWQPFWRVDPFLWILWASGVGFAVWTVVRRKHWSPRATATIAMLALASLLVVRLMPLFVAVTVVVLAPELEPGGGSPPWTRTMVDLGATVLAVALLVPASVFGGCIPVAGDWSPDVVAARALHSGHAQGRLITTFDWGHYALWHLSPDMKISFDGRRETIYSERTIGEQRAIAFGEPEGLAALSRISPEYVWLPNANTERAKGWLRDHHYRIDVDTAKSFVAVREDLPQLFADRAGTSSCFPAP